MEEILLEKSPLEEHEEQLRSRFDVLSKNREALCNENGELKDPKYEKAYNKLLNEVGELTSKVATDLTVKLYFMPDDKMRECIDGIISEYDKMQSLFKNAIRCGTYEDLENVMQQFCHNAMAAYLKAMRKSSK